MSKLTSKIRLKRSELSDMDARTLLSTNSKDLFDVVAMPKRLDHFGQMISRMANDIPRYYGVLVAVQDGRKVKNYIVYPIRGFENVVWDNQIDLVDLTDTELGLIPVDNRSLCKKIGEFRNMKMKLNGWDYRKYGGDHLVKKTDTVI